MTVLLTSGYAMVLVSVGGKLGLTRSRSFDQQRVPLAGRVTEAEAEAQLKTFSRRSHSVSLVMWLKLSTPDLSSRFTSLFKVVPPRHRRRLVLVSRRPHRPHPFVTDTTPKSDNQPSDSPFLHPPTRPLLLTSSSATIDKQETDWHLSFPVLPRRR